MDQVKFVEDSLQKIWRDMVCLSISPYHFKFFKDYLPQILLGPFLNTSSQIYNVIVQDSEQFVTEKIVST